MSDKLTVDALRLIGERCDVYTHATLAATSKTIRASLLPDVERRLPYGSVPSTSEAERGYHGAISEERAKELLRSVPDIITRRSYCGDYASDRHDHFLVRSTDEPRVYQFHSVTIRRNEPRRFDSKTYWFERRRNGLGEMRGNIVPVTARHDLYQYIGDKDLLTASRNLWAKYEYFPIAHDAATSTRTARVDRSSGE